MNGKQEVYFMVPEQNKKKNFVHRQYLYVLATIWMDISQ